MDILRIDYDMLTLKNKDINFDLKYTRDYSYEPFILNNWNNSGINSYNQTFKNTLDILYKLHTNNCAIWLDTEGNLCYRLSIDGDTHITSWKKIGFVFHNFLNLDVEIKRYEYIENEKILGGLIDHKNTHKLKYIIFIDKLIMIEKEVFNPKKKEEFFKINKLFYKNTFKPSIFLLQNLEKEYNSKYSVILAYIYHISGNNEDRFYYIINWLANMFNSLIKSSIALILIGNKESGIEIFFNDIIKPLFGARYCIEVDDNDLKNKHFDKLFSEKLFYNFNEISLDSIDKETKNICKDIIEKDTIVIEQNYKSSFQEVNIFAQTLITASKPYIPMIDIDRVNYTIFNVTGCKENIIVFDEYKYEKLHTSIKDDLNNFSLFLKSYKYDANLANKPFKEDDKRIILDCTKNIYEVFIEAIKNKDKNYFKKISTNTKLYKELIFDFDRDRIKRANLIKYFEIIYPNEAINHTRTLLVELRKYDSKFFDKDNIQSSNSEQFFKVL